MKLGYLFSVATLPLLMIITPIFNQGNKNHDKGKSENHQKNENKQKGNEDKGKENKEYKGKEDKEYKGKEDKENYKVEKDLKKSNQKEGKYKDNKWKDEEKWRDGKWDDERFESRMIRINGKKKNLVVSQKYYPDVNWFSDNNYNDVQKPKKNKKVNICHKPNGSDYPVMLNVSVNALQAHLNHGDYQGECKDYDRTVYNDSYWEKRKVYYNQYTQTTETLSFGEQLLALAIDKLSKGRTRLVAETPQLTLTQINNREVALINLQNDVYDLQQSLVVGNQRIATLNVVF